MRLKKTRRKKRSPIIRRKTVRVEGVIETFLRQEGWSDKLHVRRIIDDWESIVGTFVAAQSMPVSILRGVLQVDVGHPTYMTELSAMKIDILTKLEKMLGDMNVRIQKPIKKIQITDIKFRFNPRISNIKSTEDTVKSDSEISERVSTPVPPEIKEQAEAAVSAVNDSELRDALKTLFLTQSSYTKTAE